MIAEQVALARRAIACKGWRWMPGMQTDSKFARVVAVDSDTGVPCAAEDGATNDDCHAVWLNDVPLLPDLTDPATLGCLLALVREAWGDHATSFANGYEEPQNVWVVHNGRFSSDDYGHEIAKGSTEAEALVRALEAAP